MRRRLMTGLVALSLALVAAGCGDSGNGGSGSSTGTNTASDTAKDTAGGGSDDATAWADKVCSGIKDDIAAITKTPEIDQTNPQAAKDGLVGYLGTLETSLDGMVSAVQDAGTPPVDGGDAAVKGFLDQIADAKEKVSSAKSKVAAAPVDDPTAFQTAVTGASQDLASLGDLDPTGSFSDNKDLEAAYQKAPSCQEIENGSSTPTS